MTLTQASSPTTEGRCSFAIAWTIKRRRSEVLDPFTTCLWFDTKGEEAANFYAGIFRTQAWAR
jgi:hypothetical protein